MRRWLIRVSLGLAALLLVAQLVPYGRAHDNPAPGREPSWDSSATRALAVRACFGCHSDLTRWPWYSDVAPVSWLVTSDVDSGRRELNLTEWPDGAPEELDEIAEVVRSGEMPPWYYRAMHAEARLSAEERDRLARGLEASLSG